MCLSLKTWKQLLPALAVALALLAAVSPGAARAERLYGSVRAVVVAVRDGDTLTVTIAGYPAVIGERIGVRLAGVDAPELRARDPEIRARAARAKAYAASLVPPGAEVELRNIRRGKYFRIVAEVYLSDDNINEKISSYCQTLGR